MESQIKMSRGEKDRRRRETLKTENPEEYRRRQDVANENARRRYHELKTNNPEEFKCRLNLRNERLRIKRQLAKDASN